MSKVIYLEKQDVHSTMTTWIYCHFWQLWAAEQQGKKGYINWFNGVRSYHDSEKFAQISNQFEWFFKQPFFSEVPHREETWTWETWKDECPIPFMAQPLSVIKDYYKKNLHFNEETNRRGNLIVQKYGIDFSKTIGVGWRGGDIYLESLNGNQGRRYTPISYYYEWIDRALEQIPDAIIACTAEESEILDPLFKRYPQAVLIEEFYQVPKGFQHNPERVSPLSGYERGLQPALMVWLFSKCAWLIKNRASTSAVASWLSDGEIININHTEILGFPPHIDGVEYKGEVYQINI